VTPDGTPSLDYVPPLRSGATLLRNAGSHVGRDLRGVAKSFEAADEVVRDTSLVEGIEASPRL
jgi:hypothetical protein